MFIRMLEPLDAESYWKLRLKALKASPDAFLTTYEEAIKMENPIVEYKKRFQSEGTYNFGAFVDEELVGMVTLIREKSVKLRHRANIVAMYVDSEKRGLGIGKALLFEAINMAKSIKQLEQIYLTVEANNTSAKNLYSSVGFELFAVEKRAIKYEGKYSDEEHMVLYF